jgi:hypothetical protein
LKNYFTLGTDNARMVILLALEASLIERTPWHLHVELNGRKGRKQRKQGSIY